MLNKSDLVDLQDANRPFGGLVNNANKKIRRLFFSPGPIVEPQPADEPDSWKMVNALLAAGFVSEDIVVNCFSYHLTPAGFMFDEAIAEIGSSVFPAGVGNTDTIVEAVNFFSVSAYVGTPDFLKVILEKSEKLGKPITSIKKACVTGGPLFPELRNWYAERGIEIFQCYGTAELGLIAFESQDDYGEGLIINDDCHVEIVKTGSNKPVEDGEIGEVVVTSFNRKYSLIRFATGDLSSSFIDDKGVPRLKGWLGRADQTAKVRGMFIHPKQVVKVADRFPSVQKIRVEISENEGLDSMVFLCETEEKTDVLENKIVDAIRSECRLRGEIQFVDCHSLPNDGKVIVDKRQISI